MNAFQADFSRATVKAAVNFNERAAPIDMLLLHYTGMPVADEALDWLTCAESRVSCHYFIHEDGRVVQLVPETARAWHAGLSSWEGEADTNSRSIGIEIANPGHAYGYSDFTEQQIAEVIELCRDCGERWSIAPHRVLAHSDVAPARKQDPGEKFPWRRLFEAGVGHWVEPSHITSGRYFQAGDEGQPVEALQSMLSLYGYGVGITGSFDTVTQQAVTAFQRHFRPQRVDGVADISTIETLHRLLSALPRYA
jgi:N-acetylmuramoyl-L-alanine amidase